jgi:hypothetical protein
MTQKDKSGNDAREGSTMLFEEPCPRYEVEGWDAVFDWWYRVGKVELKTLVNLAVQIGVASQTLYNKHSDYRVQYGEQPMHRLQ